MAKLFSKKWFSNVGKSIGGVVKTAAPIAALAIPGLGPVAAAALAGGGSAAGNALQGHNLKSTVGAGLAGAAGGLAGGLAGGGLAKTGIAAGKGGLLSKVGGIAKGVGKAALDNKELILAGLSAVEGAKDEKRARALQGQALSGLQGAAGRLKDVPRPDLGSLFSDSGNPYARTGVRSY